jgi:capsular polysaccharide biosynthesis protein
MELRRYFTILRRHVVLMLVVLLVALGIAYATANRTKVYAASSVLFVEPGSIGRNPTTGSVESDPLVAAGLVSITFSKMIDSLPTAQLALQQTGVQRSPSQLVKATLATPVINTTLITVTVKDRDPALAQTLANGMTNAFVGEIQRLEPKGALQDPQPAAVFQAAIAPGTLLPTKVTRRLETFGLFGLVIAIALAMMVEYIDVTVRGTMDAQRLLELPVLGTVPYERASA